MSVRFENLFAHSVAAFKKEQCIAYIYIQNISYLAFTFFHFGNISLTTISSDKLSCLYKFIESQHVQCSYNHYKGVTVLCCHGKSCSYIPTFLVMGAYYKNFYSVHVIQSIWKWQTSSSAQYVMVWQWRGWTASVHCRHIKERPAGR